MAKTSTQIIRDFISDNLAGYDRIILEKKDDKDGLDTATTDVIKLPTGENVVVVYLDISITGTEREKPQIRVFMEKVSNF